MGTNQHRWKQWISDNDRRVLEESAEHLKWAWETDKKYPKSYPLNTDFVFAEINRQLLEGKQNQPQTVPLTKALPHPPRPPKRLSELVDENTIKAVFEQQNDARYKDALKLAASADKKGAMAWRKILYAVNVAYLIQLYGDEFIPLPQVQFLHRNFLEIADATGASDQTHEGIVEFLDDLCPCGKGHNPEALRKLRKRWTLRGPNRR